MIEKYINNIKTGIDIRKNLINIKKLIEDYSEKRKLASYLAGSYELFLPLLLNDDPKIRKNSATILGSVEDDTVLDKLFLAYESENTLYVRSAILNAIANYDYKDYVPRLLKRLYTIESSLYEEGELKHINDERRHLYEMLQDVLRHKFIGYDLKQGLVLTTNFINEHIKLDGFKRFSGGFISANAKVNEIKDIRWYNELLFPINARLSLDAKIASKELVNSNLFKLLIDNHELNRSFLFRLEIKDNSITKEDKVKFIKTLSYYLERDSDYRLVNSISRYEIELRLVKRGDHYVAFLKLFTIIDNRFEYRKRIMSDSIKPNIAAYTMYYSSKYLKENSIVLDPFCGTGTMLMERYKYCKVKKLVGIDKQIDAIMAAKCNCDKSFKLITKDFLNFTIEENYDEIITNLPSCSDKRDETYISRLYKSFLDIAVDSLNNNGIIIVLTRNSKIFSNSIDIKRFQILENILVRKKDDTYLYILKGKDTHEK